MPVYARNVVATYERTWLAIWDRKEEGCLGGRDGVGETDEDFHDSERTHSLEGGLESRGAKSGRKGLLKFRWSWRLGFEGARGRGFDGK